MHYRLQQFKGIPIDEQPLQLITIITYGEADDLEGFTKVLEKEEDAYVTIVLLGYYNSAAFPRESDPHTKAHASFKGLADKNNRVRIIDASSITDQNKICSAILERATQTK